MVGEEAEAGGVFLEWVCVSGCGELGECGDGGGEGECAGVFDGDLVGRFSFFFSVIVSFVGVVGVWLVGWLVVC